MEIPFATALRDSAISTVGKKPRTFHIEFVLLNGEVRTIERATRFEKPIEQVVKKAKQQGSGKSFYRLKDKDLILVRDMDKPNGHPYPVNIHAITKYNHLIVRH